MNESTKPPPQDQSAESAAAAPPAPPLPPMPPSAGGGPTDEPSVPARPRLRDRVLGMRAVAGVALATLVLGGLGGAAIGAVAGDDSREGRREHGVDGRFEGGPLGRPGPGPQFKQRFDQRFDQAPAEPGEEDELPVPTPPQSSS